MSARSSGRSSVREDTLNQTASSAPIPSLSQGYEITAAVSEDHTSRESLTGEDNYLDGGYGWVVTGGECIPLAQ